MWQLSEAIDGMADAARAFNTPVVGGNVSLYNESRGADIDPTPVIGLLGVVDRLDRRPPGVLLGADDHLLLVGAAEGSARLAGSAWAWARGHRGGRLAELDARRHTAVANVVRSLVADAAVTGCHDVSSGGLGLALAEMAVRAGVGFTVGAPWLDAAALFGESPSRVVLSVTPDRLGEVRTAVEAAGVACNELGAAGGDRLVVEGVVEVALADAMAAWRNRLPDQLGGGTVEPEGPPARLPT
jgi:phosphoribosylformylglycinamidine synthase